MLRFLEKEEDKMVRMEMALILIMGFVAYIYFGAEKKHTPLHKTFSLLLIVLIVHLVFDAVTICTVNMTDIIPKQANDFFHRIFVGSMIFVLYLVYRYIAILIEEETGKTRRTDLTANVFLLIAEAAVCILPVEYTQTPEGNYADGEFAYVCYAGAVFYMFISCRILIQGWREIEKKKKFAIGASMAFEVTICIMQAVNHEWLISGLGLTLMTLAFYLTLENPDVIRAELTEQKMSMLYLKSQINPHFLYNTLDTIRIQAELDRNRKVASLLMKLAGFFRMTVKVNQTMVLLEDELEMLESYMDLMKCRYPELICSYEVDPDLYEAQVPNFILQPIVENSLLHGLKNKGYRGEIVISVQRTQEGMEICIQDSGSGFLPGKMEELEYRLAHYKREEIKYDGNSVGVLNVQKRIKFLCGPGYGLSYTKNEKGGVTAHLLLPFGEEKS